MKFTQSIPLVSCLFPFFYSILACHPQTVSMTLKPVESPGNNTKKIQENPLQRFGKGRFRLLWERELKLFQAPVIARGLVFVPCADGVFRVFDLYTGRLKWQMGLSDYVHTTRRPFFLPGPEPRVVGSTVFCSISDPLEGVVFALDAQTGTPQWHFRSSRIDSVIRGPVFGGIAMTARKLLVIRTGGGLTALCATDGREMWNAPFDPSAIEIGFLTGRPAVKDNIVFAGADFGVVRAFDTLHGGRQIWETATEGRQLQVTPSVHQANITLNSCEPLLVDSRLLVADGKGFAYALNIRDGAPFWKSEIGITWQFIAPIGGDIKEEVLAATERGIVALSPVSGQVLRSLKIVGGVSAIVADRDTLLVIRNATVTSGWMLLNRKDWKEITRDDSFGVKFVAAENGFLVFSGFSADQRSFKSMPKFVIRVYAPTL